MTYGDSVPLLCEKDIMLLAVGLSVGSYGFWLFELIRQSLLKLMSLFVYSDRGSFCYMNRYDNLVNLTPNLWSNNYFEYRISLIVKMTAAIGKNSIFKVKLFMLGKSTSLSSRERVNGVSCGWFMTFYCSNPHDTTYVCCLYIDAVVKEKFD